MNADEIKSAYAATLKETVFIRRYTGSGPARPKFDAAARARAVPYAVEELVGSIVQGDQKVIVLVEDLINNGLTMPVTTADKVVVFGRELAIIAPLARKAMDGTLVAYELQARG